MRIKTIGAVALAFAAGWTTPVLAQDEVTALEEIIVTAQRREQTLQDVPISVTAFDETTIEQNNWTGSRSYIEMTPNVFFSENDSQGQKNGDITVRGISDLTSGANERIIQTRPAIGVYVDDFSVASIASGSANPPLGDIERIEILRGPQGTYFGRNATGGAINIVSVKPHEGTEGKITLGVGNYETYRAGGLVNVPITDNLFGRFSASWQDSGGFVSNLTPTGSDSDYENQNLRAAFRWQPGDWTFDLTGQRIIERQGNQGKVPAPDGPGTFPVLVVFGFDPEHPDATCGLGAGLNYPGNIRHNCENADTFTNVNNTLVSLKAVYNAANWSFTSVTGNIRGKFRQFEDLDNTGQDLFNRRNDYDSDSFSQEFRIASSGAETLDWMAGAFLYRDEFQVNNTIITGVDTVPLFTSFLTVPGDYPNENNQFVERDGWAVFGDVTWHINDELSLSIGGRYSDDTDEQYWRNTYASFACGTRMIDPDTGEPAPLAPACELRPDQAANPLPVYQSDGDLYVTGGRMAQTLFTDNQTSDTDFSPRVALNWKPDDDQSVFLTVGQGYRPAGVRVAPDSDFLGPDEQLGLAVPVDTRSTFKKEKVTNIELGWKAYLNDRQTRVEASIFHTVWDDMQVRVGRFICRLPDGTPVDASSPEAVNCVGGVTPDNRVQNANEAESQGIELTAVHLIGDNIKLAAAVGFLDAEFTDFKNAIVGDEETDVSGQSLINAPDFTASASAEYNWSLANSDAYVRLEANHRAGVVTRLGDIQATSMPLQTEDYTVLNLRAGMEWENHRLNLSIDNLTEEDYTLGVETFAPSAVVLGHPRFVNLNWTTWFGD